MYRQGFGVPRSLQPSFAVYVPRLQLEQVVLALCALVLGFVDSTLALFRWVGSLLDESTR